MKPLGILIAALALLPGAMAVDQTKSVIVWFEDSVPQSIIDQAKTAIITAGGRITHVYSLINGFAADAPAAALDTIQTYTTDCHIEEDEIVSASS